MQGGVAIFIVMVDDPLPSSTLQQYRQHSITSVQRSNVNHRVFVHVASLTRRSVTVEKLESKQDQMEPLVVNLVGLEVSLLELEVSVEKRQRN